jgi:hypothetical protein
MYPEKRSKFIKNIEEVQELKKKLVKEFTSTAEGVARF